MPLTHFKLMKQEWDLCDLGGVHGVGRGRPGQEYGGLNHYWEKDDDPEEECGRVLNEENDDSHFALELDVKQFRPEELRMKLDGHKLTVKGYQQFGRPSALLQRSFDRSFSVPEEVAEKDMFSSLTDNGVLHIEGPKKRSKGAVKKDQ